MEQVLEAVLAAVPSVGSVTTYPELLESLPAENRQYLPNALRELKRSGKITKGVFFENGENIYRITRAEV